MEHPALSAHTKITDMLSLSPRVATALMALRVDCVGCSMNKFCTLEELCRHYGLEMKTVLEAVSASGETF